MSIFFFVPFNVLSFSSSTTYYSECIKFFIDHVIISKTLPSFVFVSGDFKNSILKHRTKTADRKIYNTEKGLNPGTHEG
jgi:hypothetical protein